MRKIHINKKIYPYIPLFFSIFVYLGAIAIYFYANGWRIDPINQLIIKTGVLTVESDPFLATVYVEGEEQGRTPKSVNLAIGNYNISVYRSEYLEWKKNIEIKEEKSTPVYPWLIREKIEKENIYILEGNKYINSWMNDTNDYIYFLTNTYSTLTKNYSYTLYRFDVNPTFWDLSSNPRPILTFDFLNEPNISLTLSPDGILGVMGITNDDITTHYLLDSSKSTTLETLTILNISQFSSYTMSWAYNNQYLMFESSTDLIAFDIQKQTRYLLIQNDLEKDNIWATDNKGFFYKLETNTENTNENIYSYLLVQEFMDGSSPSVLVDDLFFQKDSEYILRYREDTGNNKYSPFTNSPESTKSVGKITKILINQDAKGVYIQTDTSSYWYNIGSKKYYLISPYPSQFVQFSLDNRKLIYKDELGYSVFTFLKDDGDHTIEIGSKLINGINTNTIDVNWISNSLYIWYIKDNSLYISDIDGENTVKVLDSIDTFKHTIVALSAEKIFTLYISEGVENNLIDTYIDSYLIH